MKTKEAPCKFRPSGAYQTGETENLARSQLQRNITETGGGAGEVIDTQNGLADRHLALRKDRFDLATDHHPDERDTIGLLDRFRQNGLTIAKHRHPIGKREDLFDSM